MGIPAFACTPDQLADLTSSAVNRQELNQWVAEQGITAACGGPQVL